MCDLHGHERGAITFETGVVLVAGGLMDAGLRAKLRLHWVERHTVAHLTTVATALTDLLIDHGKHVRLSLNATFTLAPLFRSTLLVVDEHGHSRRGFPLAG